MPLTPRTPRSLFGGVSTPRTPRGATAASHVLRDDELMAGYLQKKTRSLFSGWQLRYFVLCKESGGQSATLKYWDTEKSYASDPHHARGEITMRVRPELAQRIPTALPAAKTLYHMQITLPGRVWVFRSEDNDQIESWLTSFQKLEEMRAEQDVNVASLLKSEPIPQDQNGKIALGVF
jgi:hypothetical protein